MRDLSHRVKECSLQSWSKSVNLLFLCSALTYNVTAVLGEWQKYTIRCVYVRITLRVNKVYFEYSYS